MDIDDLEATLRVVRTVLRAGGWFHFSLLHPCFPGKRTPTGEALSSWPPSGGYAAEGWWSTRSTGVRGHVGAHHRTLSTYLNAILAAGLQLTALAEPDPVLPRILIIDGRRPD